MNPRRLTHGPVAAAAILGISLSALWATHASALPLAQPSDPATEEYLLGQILRHTGIMKVMSDTPSIDLTALSIGAYTQVYTPTTAFVNGEITQSLASEVVARPGTWVAPVLTNDQAFMAILVQECPESIYGWQLMYYYPVDVANGLAAFEPNDRLMGHWNECLFRLREEDLIPLEEDAEIAFPGGGTLSEYQQMLLDTACPEDMDCGSGSRDEPSHSIDAVESPLSQPKRAIRGVSRSEGSDSPIVPQALRRAGSLSLLLAGAVLVVLVARWTTTKRSRQPGSR